MSGNDFTIILFVINGHLTTRDFADIMIDQFGRQNCSIAKAAPMKFDDQRLSGTTLNAVVAGNNMVIDVHRIPSDESQTKLLVMQDSLDEGGKRSIEGKTAFMLLKQSSKLEPQRA